MDERPKKEPEKEKKKVPPRRIETEAKKFKRRAHIAQEEDRIETVGDEEKAGRGTTGETTPPIGEAK
ncbi:hypothetical protein Trydic_g5935 [Trypoxylus dichotomus]